MRELKSAGISIDDINRLWRRVSPRVERAATLAVRRAEQILAPGGKRAGDAAMLLALLPAALVAHARRKGLF